MLYELINQGLSVESQKGIPVVWNEINMEIGFRADLIVEKSIIV